MGKNIRLTKQIHLLKIRKTMGQQQKKKTHKKKTTKKQKQKQNKENKQTQATV